jgi:hypothetical protein
MADDGDAFFLPEPDGDLSATPWTRGPWDVAAQHGGPPSALLARAIDRAVGEDRSAWVPARTVVELLRPVPIARLRATATLEKRGRQAIRASAVLEHDGAAIARARALLVRSGANEPALASAASDAARDLPPPAGWPVTELTFFLHPVGYHRAMEIRMADPSRSARARAWSRMRMPLVLGETPSGWERALCFADAAHGIASGLDPMHFTQVNPDLELSLFRRPTGEWIGLDVDTRTTAIGTGLTRSRVFDESGDVGAASATLIVRRR